MSALDEVCQRLNFHFDALLAIRRQTSSGRLYALEHPLVPAEVTELQQQLRVSRLQTGPLREHRLAWIVLATECGYEYGGAEYWPMLEKRIPPWQFGDRERLRGYFEDFADEFSGARPSGTWARHFSVIAWPITHAILPRDLQVYLSHAVYLARHYLGHLESRTNADVGEVVAKHAYTHGDRFTRFIRQHDFVGALVKLLLHAADSADVFEERTFRRIVSDLEKHAEARYWLKEARNYVSPKIRVASQALLPPINRPVSSDAVPSSISPGLVMRNAGDGLWHLHLQPPSLISLLQQQPALAVVLNATRYGVVGGTNQLFQLRDLMSARPRERLLQCFPAAGQPLIISHPAEGPVARLLQEESVLAPRKAWVFRLRRDGSAWLQASTVISPGNTYLLAAYATLEPTLPGALQACPYDDMRLTRLEVPRDLTDQDAEHFKSLGLGIQRRTTVSAWGILPRRWNDGEFAEFVEGDPILLRVERDHAFDTLRCTVDSAAPVEHSWSDAGDVTLKLCDLLSGEHHVRLDTCRKIRSGGCISLHTLSTISLRLRIRPPSPWQPDQIPHEAITIHLEPVVPTLEEILNGAAILTIRGNVTVPVHVELVLADDTGEFRHVILHRKPPILEGEWRSRLTTALKHDDIALRAFGADRGYFAIKCDRFGLHRALIGVFPKPVRWNVSLEDPAHLRLRLRCDGTEPPDIVHYSFDSPGMSHTIAFEDMSRGIAHANGLFIATLEDEETSLVVSSPPRAVHGLEGLRAVAEAVGVINDSAEALASAYRRWAQAPAVGKLVEVRREQVLSAMQQQLVVVVAGRDWANYERRSQQSEAWQLLENQVSSKYRNYGITLGKRRGLTAEPELFEAYRTASISYGVTTDIDLMHTAWSIAFDPARLPLGWSMPTGDAAQRLIPLTRAARLLKLGQAAQCIS